MLWADVPSLRQMRLQLTRRKLLSQERFQANTLQTESGAVKMAQARAGQVTSSRVVFQGHPVFTVNTRSERVRTKAARAISASLTP